MTEAEGWDKLKRLAEKHRASDDPDISKALEAALVAEAQSLAQTATAKPAWLVDFPLIAGFFSMVSDQSDRSDRTDTTNSTKDVETTILSEEPLPNDIETAERLIRDAHLHTMRGDKARAKDLLSEAEKAAPRSAAVLVALGDEALGRHNIKEAIRLFGLAKDAEPGNVAIEKKHADAVFRQSQGLIFDPMAKPGAITDVASAKASVILSFMAPGLGQIVVGETVKGGVFLIGWIACIVASVLIGFDGLWAMLGMKSSRDANFAVLVPIVLGIIFWLGAILDASSKAKRYDKPKINRPTPPSNLPFE